MLTRAYPDHAGKHLAGAEAVETMRLYQRILEDVPDSLLEAACVDHIAGSQWWPKPSELRERCLALATNQREAPTAIEAWGVARRAAVSHHWQTGNPAIDAVMGALGWRDFCASELDDEASWRARFVSGYEMYMQRQRTRDAEHPAVREARLALASGGMREIGP